MNLIFDFFYVTVGHLGQFTDLSFPTVHYLCLLPDKVWTKIDFEELALLYARCQSHNVHPVLVKPFVLSGVYYGYYGLH